MRAIRLCVVRSHRPIDGLVRTHGNGHTPVAIHSSPSVQAVAIRAAFLLSSDISNMQRAVILADRVFVEKGVRAGCSSRRAHGRGRADTRRNTHTKGYMLAVTQQASFVESDLHVGSITTLYKQIRCKGGSRLSRTARSEEPVSVVRIADAHLLCVSQSGTVSWYLILKSTSRRLSIDSLHSVRMSGRGSVLVD